MPTLCLLKRENVCKLENACLPCSLCIQPETEQSNMLIALTEDKKKIDQASLSYGSFGNDGWAILSVIKQ